MAGLAATLDVPGGVNALTAALAPRGHESTHCQLDGPDGLRLELGIRAAMPAIARIVDGESADRTLAGIAIDGVASASLLDEAYATRGPVGLLNQSDPYAVILADAQRGALVVARTRGAPTLYYAARGSGWVVASEPAALLTAGVPARADSEVVRHFIATGECDTGAATFFAGISAVLPGEVIVLERAGRRRRHEPDREPTVEPSAERLADMVGPGRIGIRLGPGLPGAALLGAALARSDCPKPLPVHTVTFPGMDGPTGHTPAVLVPMAHGTVRPVSHHLEPSAIDLDAFLREMGEPVPDVDFVLSWEVARSCGGDMDVLIDPATGAGSGCVARVSDRLTARYGVALRSPLRDNEATADGLRALVDRTLPSQARRFAENDSAGPVAASDVLLALRDEVAAALVTAHATDRASGIDALRRMHSGEPNDEGVLLRNYLVQRWMGAVVAPAVASTLAGVAGPPAERADQPAHGPRQPADLVVGDRRWRRILVRTGVLRPGDQVVEECVFFLADRMRQLSAEEAFASGPWLVTLSAKAVAVGQRRVRPLWGIAPGRAARTLARFAEPHLPWLAEPWAMQVAMDDGGAARVAAGVGAASIGLAAWSRRLLSSHADVFPPRAGAMPPGDSAVVRRPAGPTQIAAAVVDLMRLHLPAHLQRSFVGCAIVRADESGCDVLGFADGAGVSALTDPVEVVTRACVDNPAGQGRSGTPAMILLGAQPAGAEPRQDAGEPMTVVS